MSYLQSETVQKRLRILSEEFPQIRLFDGLLFAEIKYNGLSENVTVIQKFFADTEYDGKHIARVEVTTIFPGGSTTEYYFADRVHLEILKTALTNAKK